MKEVIQTIPVTLLSLSYAKLKVKPGFINTKHSNVYLLSNNISFWFIDLMKVSLNSDKANGIISIVNNRFTTRKLTKKSWIWIVRER